MNRSTAPLDVKVRPALFADSGAIDRLIADLDALHARERPDLFKVPVGSPRGDAFLETVSADPDQQILVAVLREKVVGYVHILLKTTAASNHRVDRRHSEIEAVSVDPGAQRLGVGRMLIRSAMSWAEKKGVRDHQIAVHDFNSGARTLYEELGFTSSVIVLRRKS